MVMTTISSVRLAARARSRSILSVICGPLSWPEGIPGDDGGREGSLGSRPVHSFQHRKVFIPIMCQKGIPHARSRGSV